jgi:DNA-directed RNA polymerase specialized sigma24 family protein
LRQIIRLEDGGAPARCESARVLGLREVYGAAVAATAGPAAAAEVTEHVMVAARGERDSRSLVGRAVLRAMRTAPHAAFAPMPEPEREAIALARLAGYSVDEIADLLGISPAEARARMTRGLRALR